MYAASHRLIMWLWPEEAFWVQAELTELKESDWKGLLLAEEEEGGAWEGEVNPSRPTRSSRAVLWEGETNVLLLLHLLLFTLVVCVCCLLIVAMLSVNYAVYVCSHKYICVCTACCDLVSIYTSSFVHVHVYMCKHTLKVPTQTQHIHIRCYHLHTCTCRPHLGWAYVQMYIIHIIRLVQYREKISGSRQLTTQLWTTQRDSHTSTHEALIQSVAVPRDI